MNSLSWFTLDGESKQIIPMMKVGVKLELKNNNIVNQATWIDISCHATSRCREYIQGH